VKSGDHFTIGERNREREKRVGECVEYESAGDPAGVSLGALQILFSARVSPFGITFASY
jgi:hypothetical protein